MKHTLTVTLAIVGIFLLSQLLGLYTVNKYISVEIVEGVVTIEHPPTALGPQPEIKEKSYSFIPITIAILIGTLLVFLLIRFRLGRFWQYWFLLAVWFTLAISFGVYMNKSIALILALILASLKVFKRNIFIHNFTEPFIYTGVAIIILPFLNLFSGFMLLLVMSVYDLIAVWKSKHMIRLAQFQTENKLFAGLSIPYKRKEKVSKGNVLVKCHVVKAKSAILGGGDIAFPLLFSVAVFENSILNNVRQSIAFLRTSIIPVCATIALLILLTKAKKDKFYPAMPFLTIGCFIGYAVTLLV
jgi:presenilin-like A22 family membrane protease